MLQELEQPNGMSINITNRCTVWKAKPEKQNTNKPQRESAEEHAIYRLMADTIVHQPAEPSELIIHYTPTLTLPNAVRVPDINTKASYKMLVRKKWTTPRPFDETKSEPRYAHLIENKTSEEK